MRRFAAWSVASQAAALLAIAATTNTAALLAACVLFGLSAGNLMTLPSLVIQREFEAASFGMLVGLSWAISQFTYAFGPGVLGVMRDCDRQLHRAAADVRGARHRRRRADPAAAGRRERRYFSRRRPIFR